MQIAQSRITAQGQISIPAAVRRMLGIGPGSLLEWELRGDCVVVRRAGQYPEARIKLMRKRKSPGTVTVLAQRL